jgi:S-adenosylmethionine decarboxylase
MSKKVHKPTGHHYIVEASGCDPDIISSVSKVKQILVKAAEIAGATVLAESFNEFSPKGVSGVVVISESHISTHTWPEYGYGALDIYTCGDDINAEKAIIYAVEAFCASTSHMTEITRGIDGNDRIYYHSIITWEEEFEKPQNRKIEKQKTKKTVKKT